MAEDKTPELEFFTGKPFDQKAAASKGRPTPAKDFFTGTDFSTVPESYSTRRQLEDGLFINEITRPIKGNVEDYTKYGVPLYRGFDWDEIRARNQGTVEKWVNGIAKAGVVTATSFTENLLGVPMGIISMASGGDFFDNSLGRRIDKINDWMQENMPNYRTRQEENNSVLAGLGTANFWADTFLNGLGYSIGSIASVYATGGVGVIGMTSRLGSAAARGMGIYKAAKAIATGTKLANTLQKGARVGTNVLNAAKVADMGFMMALAESSVESRETKRNMLEMLQQDYMEQEGLVNISQIPADVLSDIEDTASAAGNTNFIANLAIVGGTNMFMFGKMALGFNGATKKLNNVIYDRALGKFVNTMPNQSVRRAAFEKAALLSRNSLGELAQEGGQYASNIYATEVHGEKFHDGGSVDRMQALNKAFTDTFGDKEGRESMLVGALVGLFMGGRGAFGPTQTQKDNGKREALVKILNSGAFNGISREMQEENVQSATIKKMELAAQRGDIKTFKDLQARLIQNHAFSLIERGGYDVYMEMLEDSKTLSDADFMDRFGFPKENEKGVPYTIEEHLQGKTKSQFIDGVKEKVEHVNKIYKNVNDMFPLPNQTQGLPRVLMGEAARAAEDRAFNRAYNLRRELAGYGYGLYDRARRRSQIVENIQKEIDNNPILKALNINVDSELAKIKELESADIKDMSNSFQTLADKEVEKAKVFDDIMSKINAVAQSPKIGEMIEDYLSLGLKDVSAIDAYNRLASDPNYRKAFHEELERNQATQKDSALDKKVEEVILGAKTSEELETQRPAADTMTDSQIEALRERKAELIKEEDAAKRKYLKRVENKTEEDALEDLKGIDRENLSPTDIVGLRSAIAVMQGKVDSIKSDAEKGADAARNIFKGPQPQGDPNLTPEALGGVEKVSEDGRHFVINGKKYYNDKPNIEDVLKTPGKVTLKSENGNPATFTNDLTVQGITLAIKAAVARRESTSQPDNFNTPTGDKLIQQIDLFGDAVKYWTDQVTEAVKNKEIAPLPQRDYDIVRKEILDLAATLEVGNRLNDALSASKEGNNFSKSVIEKALGRLNTLINTRINTLEKVLQPTEATVDDITNLIEELTQQLETFKATDNNTSNATASKALTKYLTELIRFKIETLKNKLDDSSETDEDTEPPGPTPPTTPGPDAGQTGTGKATDPGTTSESQEFPVVTEETQELPDEPTSNVFDEQKESIDPVEPGQVDNSTRPPLFDEHGNIQITEESQELPDEPTRDVFETDPASPAQQASEVKQSNIDDLLSKEKTIKIGRYTPSSRFSDRVSGENLFLEVIDALNSIVSFNKTISSEQIKQIDEVLDLFAPVLSIKTIDRIIAKYEEEDANFLEVLDRLNKLKQKELAQISAMQGDEFGAARDAAQQTQQQGVQVMYTPKGKARQTYTIVGTKIFNANGKEVYKKDSADRRKIFANLAIQQKRARVVEYKGNKYIVNDKDQIMSVATGKIMQWGENDGNRKAILALAKPTTSTVSTNQYAATPPDATYTPKPGGMQLMNDASFKTRDSSGRYYVAVNPDGTPDLMAALMPDGVTSYGPVTVVEQDETELTEKVLIPNTGLLVSSSPGESVSFVLARELWFNDTLSNYEDFSKESVLNQRFEDIPIHVYKDGSFVGRLESANPTNRLERKEIVRRLAKGETVTAPITKIVGTNPNYARSTEDEQGYFSDPREIITGDLNIAAVSLDRGVMSLESGVESINEDFLEIASSINFSNLLPGSVVFKVNPSQTPNNEVNFVKGFTRNLDGAAINAVNRMLSEGNMEGVKEVVANSPASDSQSDTYLNIDKFGQTGQNFMVFKSPKLGRMVRVSSEEMLKAMRSNGVAKVGLVAFSDETDQFETDKSAKVPKGYNVRKDFQEFIQGKKFQVDVEKANNNAPFYNPAELENGSPKYYESYQEYLFGDRYEGMNGHNSILSLDVVEVNGSIYHDLGVAFDRLSASGEAADKVVAAVNNIKPAQVSKKIQAIRANRNLDNRRRNNNIQDTDDFYCD